MGQPKLGDTAGSRSSGLLSASNELPPHGRLKSAAPGTDKISAPTRGSNQFLTSSRDGGGGDGGGGEGGGDGGGDGGGLDGGGDGGGG